MTVHELIEHLKTLPSGALVIAQYHSDYVKIDPEWVEFVPAAAQKIAVRRHAGRPDQYSDYSASWWPKDEQPLFMDFVRLRGN